MDKRFFTLQQARQLLASLRPFVQELVSIAGELESYREEIEALSESAVANSGSPRGSEYLGKILTLQHLVEKIQGTGVLIKSVQQGLLDFPHLKDGREVYLCWQLGEDDIHFWHEVDAGYAGRTPIQE